jgi:hypothetical protein
MQNAKGSSVIYGSAMTLTILHSAFINSHFAMMATLANGNPRNAKLVGNARISVQNTHASPF